MTVLSTYNNAEAFVFLSIIAVLMTATAQGQSHLNPIPIGTPAATTVEDVFIFDPAPPSDVKLTILEILHGAEAWDFLKHASGSDKAPETGFEYIAVRIRLEYYPRKGARRDRNYEIQSDEFTAASAEGKWYGDPAVTTLPNMQLKTKLFPGESSDGWLVFTVPEGDRKPLMFFGRGNLWFQLYR
jgi:hypothetical protein